MVLRLKKLHVQTNTRSISIPDNTGLSQTVNHPVQLKEYAGARVMLTEIITVSDTLINGSNDTAKHLDLRSKSFCSTIYIKFVDPKAGNFLKDRRRCGELKECAPVTARTKRFPIKKGKNTVS